jgi:hypothetical protein
VVAYSKFVEFEAVQFWLAGAYFESNSIFDTAGPEFLNLYRILHRSSRASTRNCKPRIHGKRVFAKSGFSTEVNGFVVDNQ